MPKINYRRLYPAFDYDSCVDELPMNVRKVRRRWANHAGKGIFYIVATEAPIEPLKRKDIKPEGRYSHTKNHEAVRFMKRLRNRRIRYGHITPQEGLREERHHGSWKPPIVMNENRGYRSHIGSKKRTYAPKPRERRNHTRHVHRTRK